MPRGGGPGHGGGMNVDDLQGKIYDRKLYGRLFVYVKPYMHIIAMAFVVMLALAFVEIYLPLVTKTAMDDHVVSNRSILILDDEVKQEEFEKRYGKLKFNKYDAGDIEYVIVPTKKRKQIGKKEITEYTEAGMLTTAKYYFTDNNSEHLKILNSYEPVDKEVIILSEKELAFSETISKRFKSKDWLKLRERDTDRLMYYGLIYLIFVLLQFAFNFLQVFMTTYASQHAMNDLRKDLFGHLQRMPVSFFDKNPVGRLVTRVTNDIRTLDEMLATGAITIIQDVLKIIAIMILMLNLNVELSLVSFSLIPIIIMLIFLYKKKIRPIYREVRKKIAGLNATLAEHMSGSKIIQIFNQYDAKKKEFSDKNESYYRTTLKQLTLNAFFNPLIRICTHIAIALIIWYGGGKILDNVITIGLFMAFTEYVRKLFEPINQFSQKFDILQAALTGAERIFGLMDDPQDDYREELTSEKKFDGSIEFKNLWLAYNQEEWVLKDVSFKINPGEKVALVGHTGSGKTSIVNLILGMYPYQKGEILLDGEPIKSHSLPDIRSNIGIVQQDVFLFSGTIKDNIVLNNEKLSQDRLEEVAHMVNVDKFIDTLPGKYEEPVQERGATFSVGQRQLIAFARVLAYDPSIFILDEATSNIDTETEILIQSALERVMENRTSIIIAHRLSTIQHCDRIIVLHKGKIMEEGNHQELLQKEGLYYDLYKLQYS